jgi:hypothetical protein
MSKRGTSNRHVPAMFGLVGFMAIGLLAITAPAVLADPGDIGFQGPSFSGSGADPTSSKPESKVWFNDGFWWASMYNSSASAFTIHRLSGTTWTNTGVVIDDRETTHQDALWDGTKLYVASHVYSTSPASGFPARLQRYSYNPSTDTYSLDGGFPAQINNWRTETLVLDKDSTGQLWATWTRSSKVYVNRSLASDTAWGGEFTPSVTGTSIGSDDISTLVAFGGDKVGLLWSNQSGSPDSFRFSIHQDNAGDTTWGASVAILPGNNNADDHLNLKADPAGNLYAVVKTSLSGSGDQNVVALRRAASNGAWTSATVINRSTTANQYTRGVAVVDTVNNLLHVYATSPESNGTIYEKTSPLNALSFTVSGLGTPFIRDNSPNDLNNATTTKQPATSTTGILVLAGHETLNEYWWNATSFGPPPNAPPTASPVAKSTPHDVPTTINMAGTDAETCQLTFVAPATGPAHGALGSITPANCAAGSPNSDSATVQYTPALGYSGPDSFTYTVSDGTNPPVSATVTLTVTNAAPTATGSTQTTPEGATKTVTLNGADADNCDLTFVIATGPTHGAVNPITPLTCAGTGPFTDTATVDYTPTSGYNGPDSFTFTVSDGVTTSAPATVSITVGTPPNAPPTASPVSKSTPHDVATTVTLAGTDAETCDLAFAIVTGPANGSLGSIGTTNCALGSPNSDSAPVLYTPAGGYVGPDSFTYSASDGVNPPVQATVTLTVTNAAPTANGSNQSTAQGVPVTFNLTGSDPDDCNLTFAVTSTPAKGGVSAPAAANCTAASPNTDRASVTYTPTAGQTGGDSFTFTVTDGLSAPVQATVNITISSGAPTTTTFLPVADAHVNTSNVNGNYGTLTTIKVREGLGTTADPNYRGYLKFNISGVTGSVSAVKLRLFVTDVTSDLQSIFVVPDGWTETEITYTNAPPLTGLTAVGSATAPALGYVEITLAPTTVNASTTTLSLAIKSAAGNSAVFSSREDATNKPQLLVTYQ